VGAEVIARILCAKPGPGNNGRLTLCGAQITGPLDLSYARIEHPITLRDCVFDQPIVLAEARLGALTLDGGGDATAVWIFQLGTAITTATLWSRRGGRKTPCASSFSVRHPPPKGPVSG